MPRPGEMNTEHCGLGVYFRERGHSLEMITRLSV
jgi:hypothetical protein